TVDYTETGHRLSSVPETATNEAESEAAATRAMENSAKSRNAAEVGEEQSKRSFEQVLTALQEFQERSAEPAMRAREAKAFWQRMFDVENRLRAAANKYGDAARFSTVDAEEQVFNAAEASRLACADMIDAARQARIPARSMTDR